MKTGSGKRITFFITLTLSIDFLPAASEGRTRRGKAKAIGHFSPSGYLLP
jgi:hypothetical protein